MAITPADIEKKTFSTALRGYDLDEVDDFLDEMVVAVRELEDELAQARTRIAELERAPNAPAPAPAAPSVDESAVGRALVAAQEAADRILEEARADADRLLSNSRTEADQILEGARSEADTFHKDREQKKAEVEAEMAHMSELVAGVRTKLAVLATTVADKLDEMDAAVAGTRGEDVDEFGTLELTVEAGEEFADASIDLAGDEEIEPEAVEDGGEEAGVETAGDGEETADEDAGSAEIEGLDEVEPGDESSERNEEI